MIMVAEHGARLDFDGSDVSQHHQTEVEHGAGQQKHVNKSRFCSIAALQIGARPRRQGKQPAAGAALLFAVHLRSGTVPRLLCSPGKSNGLGHCQTGAGHAATQAAAGCACYVCGHTSHWDRPGETTSTPECMACRLMRPWPCPVAPAKETGHQAVGVVTDTTRLVRLGAMPKSTEEHLCSGTAVTTG